MSTGSPPRRRWLDSAAWLRSRPAAATPPATAYTAAVTATPTARFTSSSSTDSDGMNPPSATSTGEHRKARPKRRLSAASNEQSSVSSIGPSRLTSTHNRYLTLHRSIHTVPYPVGPTHPSNLKCLCRFHHLLKTFWNGASGWRDRQLPDGTVEWTSPTGHTYTTYPGSKHLFPQLCEPTATLWPGEPPVAESTGERGAMMPRRRHTRAH